MRDISNQQFPSLSVPAVDERRLFTDAWSSFFSNLVALPKPIIPVDLSGSPMSYKAPTRGTLSVVGGVVSGSSLIRGRVSLPLGTSASLIPMSPGDTVTVYYSAPPALNFVPA